MSAKSPISQIQKRKLIELVRGIRGDTEPDAVSHLEKFFKDAFGHGTSEASYEEGARMTAQLLTEQRTPGSSTGRNGDHAAKANPNACPECGEVAPAHTAACSIGKSMLPAAAMSAAAEAKPQAVSPVHPPQSRVGAELPESPYSWNLHAEAKDGWDEQFTIRASDSHAFIEKIEGLKKYLGERGYKPATRGAGRGRAPENTGADGEEAPICAIHHKAMIKVQGKKGAFWSCHEKLEDGSYCPFKPASK